MGTLQKSQQLSRYHSQSQDVLFKVRLAYNMSAFLWSYFSVLVFDSLCILSHAIPTELVVLPRG